MVIVPDVLVEATPFVEMLIVPDVLGVPVSWRLEKRKALAALLNATVVVPWRLMVLEVVVTVAIVGVVDAVPKALNAAMFSGKPVESARNNEMDWVGTCPLERLLMRHPVEVEQKLVDVTPRAIFAGSERRSLPPLAATLLENEVFAARDA